MNKRLTDCQFKGFIGTNRYAYRAFHDKIIGCTRFMLYGFISPVDGWCCIIDKKIKGYLTEEEIGRFAESEIKRIEAL